MPNVGMMSYPNLRNAESGYPRLDLCADSARSINRTLKVVVLLRDADALWHSVTRRFGKQRGESVAHNEETLVVAAGLLYQQLLPSEPDSFHCVDYDEYASPVLSRSDLDMFLRPPHFPHS